MYKNRVVNSTLSEALFDNKGVELLKPGVRCLYETVDSLAKLVDMIRTLGVDKPCRLSHKNNLLKKSMQKCVLDIQLS